MLRLEMQGTAGIGAQTPSMRGAYPRLENIRAEFQKNIWQARGLEWFQLNPYQTAWERNISTCERERAPLRMVGVRWLAWFHPIHAWLSFP